MRAVALYRHGRPRLRAPSGCATTSTTFGDGGVNNVMIFGQSGRGGKVVRMMHMPVAKGALSPCGGAERRQQHLSDDRSGGASIKAQQTIAAHTLKNLNLTGADIDKLKTRALRRA